MRSDYFRLCALVIEGGLYVDCDDVLLNDGWTRLFEDDRLKLQPLCYDISVGGMMQSTVSGRRIYLQENATFTSTTIQSPRHLDIQSCNVPCTERLNCCSRATVDRRSRQLLDREISRRSLPRTHMLSCSGETHSTLI